MMRTIDLFITDALDGRTVLSLLKNELQLSGTLIKRLKRSDGIRLSGTPVHTDVKACLGQILSVDISATAEAKTDKPSQIVFEDDDIIVFNKPAGILVHSTKQNYEETTVADIIRSYIGADAFHPVNRLDRNTSGLMVIAKNGYMHNLLKQQLHTEKFCRRYLAVTVARPELMQGEICLPIARDSISPIRRVVASDGKFALTKYRVIASNGVHALLEAEPVTGRTHQIRLHLSAIGCPIVGDFLYGTESDLISRTALHSNEIKLYHPLTGEFIDIKADMPPDMQRLFSI